MKVVSNDVRKPGTGYWSKVLDVLLEDKTVEVQSTGPAAYQGIANALITRKITDKKPSTKKVSATSCYVWLEEKR